VLVGVKETSESKPFDDASLGSDVVKTRGEWNLWEKPAGVLITGQAATGVKGGVTLTQAFNRNCRNQSLQCKGRSTSG
jgi:hypothetical protein